MGKKIGRYRYHEKESPILDICAEKGITAQELANLSSVNLLTIYALANGVLEPITARGELRKPVNFPRYYCKINRVTENIDLELLDNYSKNISVSPEEIIEKVAF